MFILCANTDNMVTGSDTCKLKRVWFFQNVINILTIQPLDSGRIVVQPTDYESNSTQYFRIECGSKPGLFYLVHNVTG